MEADSTNTQKPTLRECLICGLQVSGDIVVCSEDGSALIVVKPDPYVGTTLADRFEIISLIGSGGMGNVYKARHTAMDRMVAIKILHTEKISKTSTLRRFQQEARTARDLAHPNIVNVFDFGLLPDNIPYIVMDYIEGQSLYDLIDNGRIEPSRSINIFTQVCDALAHAHQKGVIHRDIKPSNIMLMDTEDIKDVVKVLDFGIAKVVSQNDSNPTITVTGEVFGSPHYMSPEQCTGKSLDARSDIYSLGCVIYECLTGRPPVSGDNVLETMHKHSSDKPLAISELCPKGAIPQQLEAVVFKALEKNPENRFQSMTAFKRNLEFVPRFPDVSGELLKPHKTTGSWKPGRGLQRGANIALIAVGIAVAAVALDELGGGRRASSWSKEAQLAWVEHFEGSDSEAVLPILHDLADTHYKNKELGKAIAVHERWLELTQKVKGKDSLATAQAQEDVADFYGKLNNLRSKYTYQQAIETLQAIQKDNSKKGKAAENGPLYNRIVELQKKLHGTQHPETAKALLQMAEYLSTSGSDEQAAPIYEQAISVRSTIFGADHPLVADAMIARARSLVRHHEFAKAEELLNRALDIKNKKLGPQSPAIADISAELGVVYQEQGKFDKAETTLLDAIAIQKSGTEGDTEKVANLLDMLAGLYNDKQEFKKSEEMYRLSLSMKERLAAQPASIAKSMIGVGKALMAQAEYLQAESFLKRALEHLRTSKSGSGTSNDLQASAQAALKECLQAQGKQLEANQLGR